VTDEERPGPAFEVEAATVEEFLRLLKEREQGEAPLRGGRGVTRRAIFVARLLDRRGSSYGYPLVTRYVVAAFAYGRDAVSYRRTTSNAVELPEIAGKTEERQRGSTRELGRRSSADWKISAWTCPSTRAPCTAPWVPETVSRGAKRYRTIRCRFRALLPVFSVLAP
jgi:hypothetical protein